MKDIKKENKVENQELGYINQNIELVEKRLTEVRAGIKALMAQRQILYNIRKVIKNEKPV